MAADGIYSRVFASINRVHHLVGDDPTEMLETSHAEPVLRRSTEVDFPGGKATPQNMFRDPAAHPLILDLLLLQHFGADWLSWEFETLVSRVQSEFHIQNVASLNLDKMQACKALHLVDDFWLRWEVFLPCCLSFNNKFADFQSMQAPDVAECMVAVDIATRIREDVDWSTEIKEFLVVAHRHSGQLCPLPPLEFVEVRVPHALVDLDKVKSRWPSVLAAGNPPVGSSAEDEQLRRMLGSHMYLEHMRKQLSSQLKVLKHD